MSSLILFITYSSWAEPCPQSNASVLERLPSVTRTKDRCSVVPDPIQWFWATCGWDFLEVVSSLVEACESQQQLHGDGLHQQHCVRCAATESQASFRYHVGSRATPWNWPDYAHCHYVHLVASAQAAFSRSCFANNSDYTVVAATQQLFAEFWDTRPAGTTTLRWLFPRCPVKTHPLQKAPGIKCLRHSDLEWLGTRVASVLDSGAEGPGFKSQPRRCRVTVLGKLFAPILPLFIKQQNWWQPS